MPEYFPKIQFPTELARQTQGTVATTPSIGAAIMKELGNVGSAYFKGKETKRLEETKLKLMEQKELEDHLAALIKADFFTVDAEKAKNLKPGESLASVITGVTSPEDRRKKYSVAQGAKPAIKENIDALNIELDRLGKSPVPYGITNDDFDKQVRLLGTTTTRIKFEKSQENDIINKRLVATREIGNYNTLTDPIMREQKAEYIKGLKQLVNLWDGMLRKPPTYPAESPAQTSQTTPQTMPQTTPQPPPAVTGGEISAEDEKWFNDNALVFGKNAKFMGYINSNNIDGALNMLKANGILSKEKSLEIIKRIQSLKQ